MGKVIVSVCLSLHTPGVPRSGHDGGCMARSGWGGATGSAEDRGYPSQGWGTPPGQVRMGYPGHGGGTSPCPRKKYTLDKDGVTPVQG